MTDGEIEIAVPHTTTVKLRPEARFLMTERDWARLRKRIESLKRVERSWSSVAWFALGGVVSVALGALAWIQPYSGLTAVDQLAYSWIWIALAALGALFVAAAILGFTFSRVIRGNTRVSVDQVLEDMDDVHTLPVVL